MLEQDRMVVGALEWNLSRCCKCLATRLFIEGAGLHMKERVFSTPSYEAHGTVV